MKFKKGDLVEFEGGKTYAAKKGAKAIVENYYIGFNDEEYVFVNWIRNELSGEQADGGYLENQFTKIGEVSTQKEDRIFEENKKDMKSLEFNFNEGKQRVIDLLEEHIDNFTHDMLTDIRTIINEDRDEVVDQIEDIVKTIRSNTKYCEKAIKRVQDSSTVAEILTSMENTCYEEMEETVLNELFGLSSLTRK